MTGRPRRFSSTFSTSPALVGVVENPKRAGQGAGGPKVTNMFEPFSERSNSVVLLWFPASPTRRRRPAGRPTRGPDPLQAEGRAQCHVRPPRPQRQRGLRPAGLLRLQRQPHGCRGGRHRQPPGAGGPGASSSGYRPRGTSQALLARQYLPPKGPARRWQTWSPPR